MTNEEKLLALSLALGDSSGDLAILGEGNTSCVVAEDEFLVKASGTSLRNASVETFVRCRISYLLEAMKQDGDDAWIESTLKAARVDDCPRMPSTEAFLHAYLLSLPGISFVGHTHPIHVNGLLCAEGANLTGRLFPDHIVCCGPSSCIVPYTDPGLPLARELKLRVEEYVRNVGELPRCILMKNHGLIGLGAGPEEVLSCTLMAEKAARIQVAAYAAGAPVFLSDVHVERIHRRPDEAYRRNLIGQMDRPKEEE